MEKVPCELQLLVKGRRLFFSRPCVFASSLLEHVVYAVPNDTNQLTSGNKVQNQSHLKSEKVTRWFLPFVCIASSLSEMAFWSSEWNKSSQKIYIHFAMIPWKINAAVQPKRYANLFVLVCFLYRIFYRNDSPNLSKCNSKQQQHPVETQVYRLVFCFVGVCV